MPRRDCPAKSNFQMDSNAVFTYTYSAKQNEEVRAIRNKYLPREESKLEELKRLDDAVRSAGLPQALAAGIAGCLLFGLGMCIAMEVLRGGMVLGILFGICGMAIMIAAYPVYRSCFHKIRAKHLPRILELTEELSCRS